MECSRFQSILQDYLEGSLEEAELGRLEEHLGLCPSCSRELSSYRELFSLLEELPTAPAPETFAERVMERVGAVAASAGGLSRRLAYALGGSAVATLATMAALWRWGWLGTKLAQGAVFLSGLVVEAKEYLSGLDLFYKLVLVVERDLRGFQTISRVLSSVFLRGEYLLGGLAVAMLALLMFAFLARSIHKGGIGNAPFCL